MRLIRRHLSYLPLSIATLFLPLVLLILAAVFDFFYDQGSIFSSVLRYAPIHIALIALVVWTLRQMKDKTFSALPSDATTDLKWAIIAAGLSLVLVAIMFWPLSNWSAQLFGGSGDGYNWRWQIWRMGQEFKLWHFFPSHFNDVIAPYGVDLRLNDGYLSMYIGGVWNLFVNPTLAYNLTLASSVILNFFAARKLSLTISNSQLTALVGGVMMATAPSITLRQMGHLNLCFTFVMCLAAVEGIKLLNEEKLRVWQPILVLSLAFFSSFYFFVLSGIFYAACVLIRIVGTFSSQRSLAKSAIGKFSIIAIATGVVISPFIITRLHHDSAERAAGAPTASARTDEYMFYSADPRTFFIPPSDARMQIPQVVKMRESTSPNTVENTPFPGYLVLFAIMSSILILPRWRWFVATLWSIFTLLALGPTLIWGRDSRFAFFFPHALVESATSQPISWLPYSALTAIPGLSALRTPNRFAMILPVLGVVAISALAYEMRKRHWSRNFNWRAMALVLLLVAPSVRTSNYWYNTHFSIAVENALQTIREDSSNMRVLVAGQNCVQTISMANLQIEHQHPMIGCQTFSAAVPWYSSLHEYRNSSALAAMQCDPGTFGLAPMNPKNPPINIGDVLPTLKKDLEVGYVVFPKSFSCTDAQRTNTIIKTMKTESSILVDSIDYLIVAI